MNTLLIQVNILVAVSVKSEESSLLTIIVSQSVQMKRKKKMYFLNVCMKNNSHFVEYDSVSHTIEAAELSMSLLGLYIPPAHLLYLRYIDYQY